jgi:VCBS repeat protein
MKISFSRLFYITGAAAIAIVVIVMDMHFIEKRLEKVAELTPVTTNAAIFTRIVIDPAPPVTTLEKALADIDGDGRQDAIIGFGSPPGSSTGQGIAWYEYPHSGVVMDAWKKHIIITPGVAYEDLTPFDVNHDGAIDVIASLDNNIYWFENPRGHGGNPASEQWAKHLIGSGTGENMMRITDLDGDGLPDIITASYVFFQNSPTEWVRVQIGNAKRGIALLDIGSGKGAIDAVSTDSNTFETIWLENPREHGGDARTGAWIHHVIGTGYSGCTSANCGGGVAAYATADLNGDGRMDIVSVQAEGDFDPPAGGMLWWEMPSDPRNGAWIKHTIDASFVSAHNVCLADMNRDGHIDIVSAEQEQSTQDRVAVFYGDGAGNFSAPQVLSTGSGHNVWVSDVEGDGDFDILSAPHGYFGHSNPIELYVNQLSTSSVPVPTIKDIRI